ncbi:hypothetical protein ACRAWD_27545 [Caulobacter segnis]
MRRREKLSVTAPVGGVISGTGRASGRRGLGRRDRLVPRLGSRRPGRAAGPAGRGRAGPHSAWARGATVTLPSGAAATGRVRLISPQIDARSKLGYVRLTLPVRADIRSGGFGRRACSATPPTRGWPCPKARSATTPAGPASWSSRRATASGASL